MQRSTGAILLLLLGTFAKQSAVHAKPLTINTAMDWPKMPELPELSELPELPELTPVRFSRPIVARVVPEHFTLGHKVAGEFPLKTYESVLTYEQLQREVTVNIAYPKADGADASAVVSHVEVFLEGTDGMRSQVYVRSGGIEQHNISMDIVANNLDMLHYLVFIYGMKDY